MTERTEPKPKTDKQKIKALRTLLERAQKDYFHEPDSDAREYCVSCRVSSRHDSVHEEGCLVVAIARALRGVR